MDLEPPATRYARQRPIGQTAQLLQRLPSQAPRLRLALLGRGRCLSSLLSHQLLLDVSREHAKFRSTSVHHRWVVAVVITLKYVLQTSNALQPYPRHQLLSLLEAAVALPAQQTVPAEEAAASKDKPASPLMGLWVAVARQILPQVPT